MKKDLMVFIWNDFLANNNGHWTGHEWIILWTGAFEVILKKIKMDIIKWNIGLWNWRGAYWKAPLVSCFRGTPSSSFVLIMIFMGVADVLEGPISIHTSGGRQGILICGLWKIKGFENEELRIWKWRIRDLKMKN